MCETGPGFIGCASEPGCKRWAVLVLLVWSLWESAESGLVIVCKSPPTNFASNFFFILKSSFVKEKFIVKHRRGAVWTL